MTTFSANLGFLWSDLELPDAIRAAKAAGFDAVECHWPYNTPAKDVKQALLDTGLAMLGLNTRRGNVKEGDNGLSAIPGREQEAQAAIDEAVIYAREVGASCIHVMAGFSMGEASHNTFVSNLVYACDEAKPHGIKILIEPLNRYDAPGYFLSSTSQASLIIDEVGRDNIALMFDCYHVQLNEGDLTHRLKNLMPIIGHIQFASVPDRGPPDHGEINFDYLFGVMFDLGYQAPLGAEYKPVGPTDQTLGWLSSLGK
jgi:hydroxypyruvate isomerase